MILPDLNRRKKVLGKVTKHGSTYDRLRIGILEYQQKILDLKPQITHFGPGHTSKNSGKIHINKQ